METTDLSQIEKDYYHSISLLVEDIDPEGDISDQITELADASGWSFMTYQAKLVGVVSRHADDAWAEMDGSYGDPNPCLLAFLCIRMDLEDAYKEKMQKEPVK